MEREIVKKSYTFDKGGWNRRRLSRRFAGIRRARCTPIPGGTTLGPVSRERLKRGGLNPGGPRKLLLKIGLEGGQKERERALHRQ